jgi:hypothetical protein
MPGAIQRASLVMKRAKTRQQPPTDGRIAQHDTQ